jgi:DNA recombination protein RmuC
MSSELIGVGLAVAGLLGLLASAALLLRAQGRGELLRGLGLLQLELARLGRTQEELRAEVRSRHQAADVQLAESTAELRGELGAARRALVEMRAFGDGWSRDIALAGESLRRLEAVFAGSASRGAAGEHALSHVLGQLPPDLLECDVSFGSRVVEYALRLPGGRLLPVDSKWSSAAPLERLSRSEEPEVRRRLRDQACRELKQRARELARYLDPRRTLGLAVLAAPDALAEATRPVHAELLRDGIAVVPYSLTLPYLLTVYRLAVRLAPALDFEPLLQRVVELERSLAGLEEEVEGRHSRALVLLLNSREVLRDRISEARRATAGLSRGEPAGSPPASSPVDAPGGTA